MHKENRSSAGYLLLFVLLLKTSPSLASETATVEFVWGMAYAISSAGEKRELQKGSPIEVGDTVLSETARLQLRFTDGGFVSLAPHSEFRVNAYSYSGKSDGTKRIAMELIKGGLRTVSGLIGKVIQSEYELKTTVATIGIRGTEYTVVYGESVSGTVSAGAIAVCNTGGCLDVTQGLSYYIKDETTKPVFINTPAMLSPRQPVVAGERNSDKVAEGETAGTSRRTVSHWMGWKSDGPKAKAVSKPVGDENTASFFDDDGKRQRTLKPLFNTIDANKQKPNSVPQSQAHYALSASPLLDVRNPSKTGLAGGSDVDKVKH